MPAAAPETTVGTEAQPEELVLLGLEKTLLAPLMTPPASLVTFPPTLVTLPTATLNTDVTPEITSVVKDETVLPAPASDPDLEVITAVLVETKPLVVRTVTVFDPLPNPADDVDKAVVVVLVVRVLPAEFVVVTTITTGTEAPAIVDVAVPRNFLMSDSRAAIWVDQALGIADENHPGIFVANKAS